MIFFWITPQVKDDDGVFILSIDFQQFRKVCDLEEFYIMLEDKPKAALLCMSAAIHKVQSDNCGNFLKIFVFGLAYFIFI